MPHSSSQTSVFRYHILQGPNQGVHILEFNMQDSGGEEAELEKV